MPLLLLRIGLDWIDSKQKNTDYGNLKQYIEEVQERETPASV